MNNRRLENMLLLRDDQKGLFALLTSIIPSGTMHLVVNSRCAASTLPTHLVTFVGYQAEGVAVKTVVRNSLKQVILYFSLFLIILPFVFDNLPEQLGMKNFTTQRSPPTASTGIWPTKLSLVASHAL
jgi:hypothetical protein